MAKESSSDTQTSVDLILDNDTYDILLSNFRTSSDIHSILNNEKLNTKGLNYKDVSAEDIIHRQIALANFDVDNIEFTSSPTRINLYKSFYNYLKDNSGNLNIKYSDYIAKAPNIN